jgi:Ni,Fe-hydrogenase I small subunit
MAVVICNVSDCKNRSKRKLTKWQTKDGKPCYGCKLEIVSINKIFDPDGYIKAVVGKDDMATCLHYEPRD